MKKKKQNKMIIKGSEIKRRIIWGFNPTTRVKESKKHYSRKNYKTSDVNIEI